MFQSRAKSRGSLRFTARAKQSARSARRLRVEGMERRLMLSATTPELTLPQLSNITPLHREISFVTAPGAIGGPAQADGGWILLDDAQLHGTSVAGISSAETEAKTLDFDNTSLPQPNYTSNFVVAWSSDWTLRANALQPVAMVLTYDWGTFEPSVTSAPVHAQESNPAYSEGGSIEISTVLGDLKQQPVVEAEKTSPVRAVETTLESHHSARGIPAVTNLVPGEWGRASIFEMMNDAHSIDDHAGVNFERAKSRGDKMRSDIALPLSLGGEQESTPQAKAPRASTGQIQGDGQAPASIQTQATTQSTEAIVLNGTGSFSADPGLIANYQGKDSSSAAKPSQIPGGPTLAADAYDNRSGAVALALDEFGTVAKIPDSWGRSRVAAAVVLVLALERVAAFNSREASRQSSDAKTTPTGRPKPIRRLLRAGLQLDAR